MPAIAADLNDILVGCISAVVAAMRRIAGCRTTAHFVSAFSFFCHFFESSYGSAKSKAFPVQKNRPSPRRDWSF
jgi:hypothetical protein